MSSPSTVYIKELNLDMINPNPKTFHEKKGSKIVVIGKPDSGKSNLISALLYAKKDLIPVGIAMSGTEDTNDHFKKLMPSLFVFNDYDEKKIEDFIKRQKIAVNHLENPWCALIIDDCTDKPSDFRTPIQNGLFKKGRQWKLFYILSLQYCMDVKPSIRTNVDGVFIFRDANLKNRKSLYENYASVIPDFSLFCELMDQICTDHTALYIHNMTQKNNWRECVFWYKAPDMERKYPHFRFGCPDYYKFHNSRYNHEYVDPL